MIDLQTPVIAVAGNHDSPDRIHFGSSLMKKQGLFIVGQFQFPYEPIIFKLMNMGRFTSISFLMRIQV